MLTVPSHISSFGFVGRWVVAERQQASRFNLAFQPSIVLRKLDACRRPDPTVHRSVPLSMAATLSQSVLGL